MHVPLGKASFSEDKLHTNLAALYDAIVKVKPAAAKGTYIKSVFITSTMGPGIRLDLTRLSDLGTVNK